MRPWSNAIITRDMLPLRLLGVGATRLTRCEAVQGDLFDDGHSKRLQSLDRTVDIIREQFGTGAIRRGSVLNTDREE